MLLQSPSDKLHFAVIGQPRTGKTTFIAAMRNLTIEGPESESSSPREPDVNDSILGDKVRFIEIQNGFDKAKDRAYDVSCSNKKIDEYILVIDDRTETSWIQDQMRQCTKNPVLVRSKVQIDIFNNMFARQNPAEDSDFLSNLKKTLKENLDKQCPIYLIDSYFQAEFEFLGLAKYLLRHVISESEGLMPREKGVWKIHFFFNSKRPQRENDNAVEDDSEEMVTDPEMVHLQEGSEEGPEEKASVPGGEKRNVRS